MTARTPNSLTHDAILMIAASEGDANMYYATRLFVPDPFTYIDHHGTKILIMTDLEIDRARAHSTAGLVLSLSAYQERLKSQGVENPKLTDVVAAVFTERGIHSVLVPNNFPVGYADQFREKGFSVQSKEAPFFEQRTIKSTEELGYISEASRHTESAMRAAIQAISEAAVRDGVLYGPDGVLTTERIKRLISIHLLERDCIAQHTIVACGVQGCDPHNQGSGPLRAGEPIILDVFPKSAQTGYYADITRTVVKGKASDALKRVYDTLLAAQELVFGRLKDGIEGQAVHREVEEFFKKAGYQTGEIGGRMQGFFHGTGHGIGLDIHELPRIGKMPYTLRAGHVVTVEPGLYYLEIGGARVEDNIVITQTGYENLTWLEKQLEV